MWTKPLNVEHMFYILRDVETEGRVKRAIHEAWRRHGQGSVFTWPMVARRAGGRLPMGLPELDAAAGGLPQGRLVHLLGETSSGTHVLARRAALAARSRGWRVLCLQDPHCAASHPLPALHAPARRALEAAMERASQPFNLLIIEGHLDLLPLRVLVPLLARSGSVAVVLTGQGMPLPFARATIDLRRTEWIRSRGDIVGCRAIAFWKEGPRPMLRIPTELLFDEDDPLPLHAATA